MKDMKGETASVDSLSSVDFRPSKSARSRRNSPGLNMDCNISSSEIWTEVAVISLVELSECRMQAFC